MKWWVWPALAASVVIAAMALGVFSAINEPTNETPKLTPPKRVLLTEKAKQALRTDLQTVSAESPNRTAQELTIRIRNVSCGFEATGSGVALSPHLIVTNAHVVSKAAWLELNTWDGRSIHVDVNNAASRRINDLALIYVKQKLPEAVQLGEPAASGDQVSVVGYPEGGPLKISRGSVVKRVPGSSLGQVSVQSPVLLLNAPINHGSSGGPVLNSEGELVGIIYAGEFADGTSADATKAMAIPAGVLEGLLQSGADEFQPVSSC